MEVAYELEPKDLIAFQKYAFKTAPAVRRLRLVCVLGFGSWFLYDFAFGWGSLLTRAVMLVISSVFTFAFIAGFQALVNAYAFRKSIPKRANNGLTGWHKIVLTPQEIVETTNVNELHSLWKGIDRVAENNEYIFIYLAPNNAHVIPKRAFPDAREAARFYETAVACKDAAQNATGTNPSEIDVVNRLSPPVAHFDNNAMTPVERLFSE